MMDVLRFVIRNLDHFRPRFWVSMVAAVADGFAAFLIPVLLAEFTRGALTFARFQRLTVFIILCYGATLLFAGIVRRFGEAVAWQFGNHIRLKYFRRFERLPAQAIVDRHSGYLLSLLNNLAQSMLPVIMGMYWTYAVSVGTLVLFFIFTARESLALAFFNLAVLLSFVIISFFLSRKMVGLTDAQNKRHASLLESYADFTANLLTIKKLGIAQFAEHRLTAKTAVTVAGIRGIQKFHAQRWFILHTLYGVAVLATMASLLYRVVHGALSPSILILFVAAYASIRGTIERMSENLRLLLEAKAYCAALENVVRIAERAEGTSAADGWQSIVLRNIRFQYPASQKSIHIPVFSLRRGEIVGVQGVSGEGKTTFLNLLANFLDTEAGERTIDGIPYAAVQRKFFQERVAMISQEVDLFNLSLRDNLTLDRPVPERDFQSALEAVDLASWVRHLDNGLDTVVGEKGVKLSAGQKQRVNLIRGLLLDRDLYLLDEPTSHLDPHTEQKVIAYLRAHLAGKTAVVVSHKDAVLSLCTTRYVMEQHILRQVS